MYVTWCEEVCVTWCEEVCVTWGLIMMYVQGPVYRVHPKDQEQVAFVKRYVLLLTYWMAV